jgi:hypothetical protein
MSRRGNIAFIICAAACMAIQAPGWLLLLAFIACTHRTIVSNRAIRHELYPEI